MQLDELVATQVERGNQVWPIHPKPAAVAGSEWRMSFVPQNGARLATRVYGSVLRISTSTSMPSSTRSSPNWNSSRGACLGVNTPAATSFASAG
jgi:hypothetical protein